ncbi:hypothetical protein [Paenibacillus riograndensis]|uniref:hypothetical protein n=1 Tax=Paenibacillus riograndensis TaxID=483937 RepID=UPI0002DAEA03|nr:hypothetical protein [Paenibacillus riograndensis]
MRLCCCQGFSFRKHGTGTSSSGDGRVSRISRKRRRHYCSRNGSVCTDYAVYTLEFDVTGGSTSIGRISFELGNIADGGTGQLAVDVDDIVLTNNGTVSVP